MDVLKRLNVTIESEFLDEAYKLALAEKEIPEWLTPEFLKKLNQDWGILERNIDLALVALDQVVKNDDLLLLAKILYYILKLKGSNLDECFKELKLPDIPGGDEANLGYNCVSFFPIVAFARQACEFMISRGFDEEMTKRSMSGIDGLLSSATLKKGYPTFQPYFIWSLYHIDARLIMFDNLQFHWYPGCKHPIRVYKNKDGQIKTFMDGVKVHRSGFLLNSGGCDDEEGSFEASVCETEDYYEGHIVNDETHLVEKESTRLSKSEWTQVIKPGEPSVAIHIPKGAKIDYKTCQAEFNRARELFSKAFPEYDFRIFTINTWLLAPELPAILKPESNIMGFQKIFNTYPVPGKGLSVFNFVFNTMVNSIEEVDIDALSEESSLMRGIKGIYKKGGFVHEYGGHFLF